MGSPTFSPGCRRSAARRRAAFALANLAEGETEGGDPARGLDLFQEALRIFIAIGDRACEGDGRVKLGRALLGLGRQGDAIAMLTEAAAMGARASRIEYEGIARMLLGEARRAQGELTAAAVDLGDAVELLGRIELNTRWRAELGLAHTLAALGHGARARDHAQRAGDQRAGQRIRLAHRHRHRRPRRRPRAVRRARARRQLTAAGRQRARVSAG